ncbi:MAG: hypothetical protein WDZ37_04250 [Solirubrobacterales bacterium]
MHSRSFRRVLIPIALAGATALLGPAAAQAASYPTTVAITGGGPTGAQGTVSSAKPACRKGRTVHLLRNGTEVGTAVTMTGGAWSVSASLLAGVYQAKVDAKTVSASSSSSDKADTSKRKKKKKKRKRRRHSCLSGESSPTPL